MANKAIDVFVHFLRGCVPVTCSNGLEYDLMILGKALRIPFQLLVWQPGDVWVQRDSVQNIEGLTISIFK